MEAIFWKDVIMPTAARAVVRTTVNLSEEAVMSLREMADARGIPIAEVIRRAISLQKFVDDISKSGGKVLIQDGEREVRELVIR